MEFNPHVLSCNLRKEFESIGVDPVGIDIMLPKSEFRSVKLKNVPSVAANIIKQEMLSEGGDVATSKGAINHRVTETDIIIFGTKRQFFGLIESIRNQHFKLPVIAKEIEEVLLKYDMIPKPILGMEFCKRTYIMGILNVTPDSFSDGGRFTDKDRAIDHAIKMADDGADIIDVGGQSTRPGSNPVSEDEELKRVIPVIEGIAKKAGVIISIDTQKSRVAQIAVNAGAKIINDISALRADPNMAEVAANYDVPVVLMHMQGNPSNMQENPCYEDLTADVLDYLEKSVTIARERGILRDKIILDPGIGFGKSTEHNLEILRRFSEFKSLGFPLMIGVSRKSFIGKILDVSVEQRIEGSLAAAVVAICAGADIIRAHDVRQTVKAAKICDAILRTER